jgi:hypothetical protein
MDKIKFDLSEGSVAQNILIIAAIVSAVLVPLWPIL